MNGNDRQRDAAAAYAEKRVKQHVALALEALQDNEARARVIDWACERFKIRTNAAPRNTAPPLQDDFGLSSIEALSAFADQDRARVNPAPAPVKSPPDRAPDPNDNDAVYAWLNALRI